MPFTNESQGKDLVDKIKEEPLEEPHAEPSSSTGAQVYCPDTSRVDERKLMRKIDIRVVPWLAVLYFLNFLDRGSIGNAKVRFEYQLSSAGNFLMCFQKLYNLEPDLHISDTQYLIALTVFFFPYSLFEVSYSLHTTQRES
jgi:hypothetical protein